MGRTAIYELRWEHEAGHVPSVYVGKSKESQVSGRRNAHMSQWLPKPASFTVIRWVDDVDWKRAETEHIADMRAAGYRVLNKNKGGGGQTTLSAAHKAQVSAALSLRVVSDATRAKHSERMMGNTIALGRTHTPEARAKMSAALKGKSKSAEHRAKIGVRARIQFSGVPKSPEHRAKISAALKRRSA